MFQVYILVCLVCDATTASVAVCYCGGSCLLTARLRFRTVTARVCESLFGQVCVCVVVCCKLDRDDAWS